MRFLSCAALAAPALLPRGHGFRSSLPPPPCAVALRGPASQEGRPPRYAARTGPTRAHPPAGAENDFAIETTESALPTTSLKPPPRSTVRVERKSTLTKVYNASLANLTIFHRNHGHCNVPLKYAEDPSLGAWVNNQRKSYNKMPEERVEALNALGFDWDPRKSTYDANLEKLVAFKHKHGHCNVPLKYAEDPSLGAWVRTQRKNYNKMQKGLPGQMTDERVAALNQLRFDWDPLKSTYDANLEKLVTFKQKYGHCNVSPEYVKDPSLGVWVSRQRANYKAMQKGVSSQMTDERMATLNKLGFDWDPLKSTYDANLAKLVIFKQKHGHCNVSENYAGDLWLGRWVKTQRTSYKNKQKGLPSQMTGERVEALNELGFEWDPLKSTYDANLEKLVAFKKIYRHCNVPLKYAKDPSLGRWVCNQRANYKEMQRGLPSQMTEERVAVLNRLSFDWDPGESAYEASLAKLAAFKRKHGHCNVSKNYAGDPSLGRWVHNQRAHYKNLQKGTPSQMTGERMAALNKLSFDWDPSQSTYAANLAKLATFRQKHGNCNVPTKYADDPSLGRWVSNQRANYMKQQEGLSSPITADRVAALNKLSFDWKYKKNK